MRILRVAPKLRLPPRIGWLDYACSAASPLRPGDIAWVRFRGRNVAGLVLAEAEKSDIAESRLTTIADDAAPLSRWDPFALATFQETAALFHVPPPWLVNAALPPVPRRAPAISGGDAAAGRGFQGTLLRHRGGVPAAYAARVRAMIADHRQTIIAVPDVLRAEAIADALHAAGLRTAVCHHDLPASKRWSSWNALLTGACDALIVTKAAALAPAPRLGLVIIDGEDDADHVQQDAFPYLDARVIHEKRAVAAHAELFVASETPRFATVWRAQNAGWHTVLPGRVAADARVIPLRQEPRPLSRTLLSGAFIDAAREALQNGKSVIAFLNRTIQARSLRCADCGAGVLCPTCGLALAVRPPGLACMRCGTTEPTPVSCSSCSGVRLTERGPGIDAVRDALAMHLPEFRVHAVARARTLPTDDPAVYIATETLFKDARALLERPIGLVAALEADTGLRVPDYRAVERVWAVLERLGNVARRHACPFLMQCWEAEHPTLLAVRDGDPARLAAIELGDRKRYGYPPFTSIWTVFPPSADADKAERMLNQTLANSAGSAVRGSPGTRNEVSTLGEDRGRTRAGSRRAVRGRTTLRLNTSLDLTSLAVAFSRLPSDWIIEPEPERFS